MRMPVALLAPTSRGGPASDMEGVAMERAKKGEPEVIRYCGPEGKFVSWQKAIPRVESTSNTQQKEMRIEPPRCGVSAIMNQRKRVRPESLDSSCRSGLRSG